MHALLVWKHPDIGAEEYNFWSICIAGRGRGAARGRGRGKGVAAKNGHSADDAPPAKKGRGQAVKESAPVGASESAPAPAPKGRGRGRPRGSGKK